MQKTMDRTLIIIVTYNSAAFIDPCLRSVFAQEDKDFFVLVIDNHSTDHTVRKIKTFKNSCTGLDSSNFKMISLRKNIGFGRAVDYGVFQYLLKDGKRQADDFSHLVLINPDLCLYPDALSALVSTFETAGKDCGASGGLIMDYDGNKVTHYGAAIRPNYITYHVKTGRVEDALKNDADGIIPSDYVTGALFACELALFIKLGGFDPGYRPAYFEELDLCLKLKKIGKRAYVNPKSRARHFECGSVKKFSSSFYYYYHKNRIRCALIHCPPADFFSSLVPAEYRWARKHATKDQAWALLKAYLINLFFLPLTVFVKMKNYFLLKKIV
jgi:O-antigen biosynthesis protein